MIRTNDSIKQVKPKTRRKGIHAKTKSSTSKNSKLYTKVNKGQG